MSVKSNLYTIFPGVNIVGMHHMCNAPDELCDCVISKENFLKFIENKKFVSLENAVKHPVKSKGAYSITIDDGLRDLYDIYLVAKEKSIPITAFVSSDLIDKEGYISKEHLIEMSNDKLVTIGSHGRTHKKLTECDDKTAYEEVVTSKKEIEALIGKKVSVYAYPNGAFTKRDINNAKQAGYKYAFSVVPRKHTIITKCNMRYSIPRFNLINGTCGKL